MNARKMRPPETRLLSYRESRPSPPLTIVFLHLEEDYSLKCAAVYILVGTSCRLESFACVGYRDASHQLKVEYRVGHKQSGRLREKQPTRVFLKRAKHTRGKNNPLE